MFPADNETPRAVWHRGLANLADFAVATHARAAVLLLGFCLIAFLPGFTRIPPVDRDGPRFAQATKQMIESGDYVDIRFQDDTRYKTPIGIYWLQAAFVNVADAVGLENATRRIALYRLPSLIGAIGGVLLTYWAALAFMTRRAAILAGVMMASCILLGVEARLAKTDAMLFLTVVAAMGAMGRIYLGEGGDEVGTRRRIVLPGIFWMAIAAGILLKGPVILMIAGLTAATLAVVDRSARWMLALRPLSGLLLTLVLASPWFVAIARETDGAFFFKSLGQNLLGRVASGQDSHAAPPGYYLVLFFATFWPACIFSGLAAPAVWRDRREPTTRFLLAWLVPSWIVFELVITKLPHYVLPLYPAIAILMAGRIVPPDLSRNIWLERGAIWWFVVPVVIGIGGIVGLAVLGGKLGGLAGLFAATSIVFGFRAWWLYDVDGPERAMLRAAVASVMLGACIYARIIPFIPNLFPSVALSRAVLQAECDNPQAAAAGFHEPSIVFLTGTQTKLTDGAGAAEFLAGGSCRFALVEQRLERSFAQRAEAIGLRYARGPRIEGFNINRGKAISVAVFRSAR